MAQFKNKSNHSKGRPERDALKPVQIDETIVAGIHRREDRNLHDILLDLPGVRVLGTREDWELGEIDTFNWNEFEKRVGKILATKKLEVKPQTLRKYWEYLQKNLVFPCQVTGINPFPWEDDNLLGSSTSKPSKTYKKMKNSLPASTDIFNILQLKKLLDGEMSIYVELQRLKDKKQFTLPLADLKAVETDPNAQLLDDYSRWFNHYSAY